MVTRSLNESEDCPMYLRTLFPTVVAAATLVGQLDGAEPTPVPDFKLMDLSGRDWSLHQQKNKATVLVFLSCECPMSNAYARPVGELAAKYKERGVAVVAINANREESVQQVAAHAKEFGIAYPILKDDDLVAAKALGVKVTPEAVVLDNQFVVRYRGR